MLPDPFDSLSEILVFKLFVPDEKLEASKH